MQYYLEKDVQSAIKFLYPQGFDSDTATTSSILAATNERGDMWNKTIQDMNPSRAHLLKSKDFMCDVDDPYNILCNAMTEAALNSITKTSIPDHVLELKVGDIALILRSLSKASGLATNTRVRILHISDKMIRVQTLSSPPQKAFVPRIRFKFKIFNTDSFNMTRIQFPLRLAYCMTYNKAQGQTIENVLLDTVHPPFAHGHLYVALSRVTHHSRIRLFCTEDSILDDFPVVASVVYPELLTNLL